PFPDQREVRAGGQGVERLIGADVGRRPLPADMLLARLQRQDVAPPSLGVDSLAHDATRDSPDKLLSDGEKPKIRAAKGEVVAERLPLAHRDVRAIGAWRRKKPKRNGVDRDDKEPAGGVHSLPGLADRLQVAEKVGMLDQEAGDIAPRAFAKRLQVDDALPSRHGIDGDPLVPQVSLDHLAVFRMARLRY